MKAHYILLHCSDCMLSTLKTTREPLNTRKNCIFHQVKKRFSQLSNSVNDVPRPNRKSDYLVKSLIQASITCCISGAGSRGIEKKRNSSNKYPS